MNHQRVKSSNIHSIAHEKDVLEVRFNCSKCAGAGSVSTTDFRGQEQKHQCSACSGNGHTGTYRYSGGPAELHGKMIAEADSPGAAFNLLVRGNKDYGLRNPEKGGSA